MALSSRLFSKSNKLVYASQVFLQKEHAIPVRHFAKGSAPPSLKEMVSSPMLKSIFVELKNKFETAMGVLKKEKITIDPDDPAAVSQYANVMKTVRQKANLLSESQSIKGIIEMETQDIPDARTYLLTLQEIRIKDGLTDDLGAEAMMMEALDKVEKELKKPLLRDDKKGMDLLLAEFDKINQKLGIRKEDLPKLEDQLELKMAKAQLEELKKEALEAMETQSKREEFKGEEKADVKSLDVRNFI
ncbi:probable ATP synthase 24 kDa subunit, mitochondrial [Arachis stenosperma]|uniref:probable ATP synthase 24 kDa subunit, mitochondrial n=1 Tax=Arachis stenosperma TaxID=217475 RepID=UPI0025AC2457|nr:probable ATP synthase 24 kDa subunit, mitochondrial [Arachis stenosperma]